MKKVADTMVAACALVVLAPLLGLIAAAIFCYDRHSPFYIATRIGEGGRPFKMVKFRSMTVGADKSGVTSTAANDRRITPIGHLVRKYKLDELVQLWNVLVGDMSLVGPRPNVPSGVAQYTPFEMQLLKVRPGITDFASIVFADEGEILRGMPNADESYDLLIRPWKSRLGVFYVEHSTMWLDVKLVYWTLLSIVSRPLALHAVSRELDRLGAAPELVRIALRLDVLRPTALIAQRQD